MRLAPLVLWLSALPFAAIGLACLVVPVRMAAWVDLAVQTPTADADLRAVYGGLQLSCAALLGAAAATPRWHRVGLAAQMTLYGGMAAARLPAYALSGFPSALGVALHGGELLGLLAGLIAWRHTSAAAETPR